MAKKLMTKSRVQDEELEMLKLILEELRKVNSHLATMSERSLQASSAPLTSDDDSADELDSYE